jgi:hypothetical protein
MLASEPWSTCASDLKFPRSIATSCVGENSSCFPANETCKGKLQCFALHFGKKERQHPPLEANAASKSYAPPKTQARRVVQARGL